MTMLQAKEVAARLVAARRNRAGVPGLPEVRSFDDAYKVQEAVETLWPARAIGHKVGCSSVESQRLVNSPGPIAGRLFEDAMLQQPADLEAARFAVLGVEAEFGFRMEADLPARLSAYSREEVEQAVGAVFPLIEICDTRLSDWRSRSIQEITADNAFNGGVVVGAELRNWRDLDLGEREVSLSVDGECRGKGTGALVLGHPLIALTWLANELSRRGTGLKAGDLIAAGTCTGLQFAQPGSTVNAEFGDPLGEVVIRFV